MWDSMGLQQNYQQLHTQKMLIYFILYACNNACVMFRLLKWPITCRTQILIKIIKPSEIH